MDFESMNLLLKRKPTKKSIELEVNKKYPLLKMMVLDTKYGPNIKIETPEFFCFIPNRYYQYLKEAGVKKIQDMLNQGRPIYILSMGAASKTPILKEDARSRGSTLQFNKINVDSPLYCPHDLSKAPEFRDDLPVLLIGNNFDTNSYTEICTFEKNQSMYSIFNTPENSDNEESSEEMMKLKNLTFLGPYERYKLVKPFIQAEQEHEAAEVKKAAAAAENTVNKTDNVEEKTKELTDEDRIASLHAHFVKVSEAIPQIPPNTPQPVSHETDEVNVSFVKMGGASKKRKRNNYNCFEEDVPDGTKKHNNQMHTPVPNWKRGGNYKGNQKRGQKGNKNHTTEQNLDHGSRANQQNVCGNNNTPRGNKSRKGRGRRNKAQQQNQHQNYQHNTGQQPFTPYDYSSVNYQQFQGGASSSRSGPKPVKSNFRGKNRNNKFNRGSNNKSMMYNRRNN